MNGELLQLFPTPVGFLEFRSPTAAEKQVINEQTKDWQANSGNHINFNHYILETPGLENYKAELIALVNEYFDMVYLPVNPIELYITTSWVNKTNKGEYHHTHSHFNSLLSGTLYLDVQEDDEITFIKYLDQKLLLTTPSRQNNPFNSTEYSMNVKNNHVVIFPSSLSHKVGVKKSTGARISLSFNTFARGNFGDVNALTQLTI